MSYIHLNPAKHPINATISWIANYNWCKEPNATITHTYVTTTEVNGITCTIEKQTNSYYKIHYKGTCTSDTGDTINFNLLSQSTNFVVRVKTNVAHTARLNCDFNKGQDGATGIWYIFGISTAGLEQVFNAGQMIIWNQYQNNKYKHFRLSPRFTAGQVVDCTYEIEADNSVQPHKIVKWYTWVPALEATRESLLWYLNSLAKIATTKTLPIGSTNLAKLTDEDKKIATDKGWTLA